MSKYFTVRIMVEFYSGYVYKSNQCLNLEMITKLEERVKMDKTVKDWIIEY